MNRIIGNSLKALGLCIGLASCGHSTASTPVGKKLKDPNAGKHRLAQHDPRGWQTYPIIVLIATKHGIGIDTAGQLVRNFEGRFTGYGHNTFQSGVEAMLPTPYNGYEENTSSMNDDSAFFKTQGKQFGLSPALVASIIADFYLIGGSNRTYPEPS
ncbi:hypothetical protein [Hymenobacter sedentarius]|uniref:hypothetical protein n=1 Tax=Hymenobacter sedentarius TaxID=1411621 RepID=UPI0012FE3ED4|nr:hypothetical protein [Hymenobacter sedentarius]